MITAIDKSQIDRLRELHALIMGSAIKTIRAAIEAGEILSKIKADLVHGEFTSWCETNLPFDIRTAQRYMRCYALRGRLLKNDNVTLLSKAYQALEEPKKQLKDADSHDEVSSLLAAAEKELDDYFSDFPAIWRDVVKQYLKEDSLDPLPIGFISIAKEIIECQKADNEEQRCRAIARLKRIHDFFLLMAQTEGSKALWAEHRLGELLCLAKK